jgi:uncharacterized protein YaaR (DUF327 family)
MPDVDALTAVQYSASLLRAAGQTREKKTPAAKKSVFRSLLEKETQGSLTSVVENIPEIAGLGENEALVALKDALDMTGDALKDNPVTENFAAYRTAVQHFAQFVERRAYDVDTRDKPYRRRGWKEGRDTVIRVVDEKLEKLAAEVLANHGGRLLILARVDEINGLLIDLMS